MAWDVEYLPEVYDDLKSLGTQKPAEYCKVIEKRIAEGEPDKLGKTLGRTLAGCRRIRTGDTRIVYRVRSVFWSLQWACAGIAKSTKRQRKDSRDTVPPLNRQADSSGGFPPNLQPPKPTSE